MIVAWKNCKQFIIALSIMKAEYMALMNVAKKIKWIRQLFDELNYDIISRPSIILRMNNQEALALMKNSVNHSRFKHIDIKYHFIRETIIEGIIWLKHVVSRDIIMNFLTKSLKRIQLQRYLSFIDMKAWDYEWNHLFNEYSR